MVDGIHETVNAWAILKDKSLTILATNHALPGHSISAERVSITLLHARKPQSAQIVRIDDYHANPQRKWIAVGAPQSLSPSHLRRLEVASQVAYEKQPFEYHDSRITCEFRLKPHAVAAVEFRFNHSPGPEK